MLENEIQAKKEMSGQKQYQMPNLIFITPWNKDGYNLTIKYANKLDIVSPAWFTIRYNNIVDGNQDINESWIKKIKLANPQIKIIPRIFIEFQQETLINQANNPQLIDSIYNIFQQHQKQFDGIMIDTPYLSFVDKLNAYDLITFLQKLKDKIHSVNKEFQIILSIYGVYYTKQYQHSTIKKILKIANFVLVQTYDYQYQEEDYQQLSPIDWVQENLEYFIGYEKKILFGIPFYGFKKDQQINHIIGNEIMKLNPENYESQWDNSAAECIYENDHQIISYPCPKFIQKRLDLIYEFDRGYFIWEGGQGLEQFYQIL